MNPCYPTRTHGHRTVGAQTRRQEGRTVWRGRMVRVGRAGRPRLPDLGRDPATRIDPECTTHPLLEPADVSPEEVWWRLEDLWLRLHRHCPLRLESAGGEQHLVVTGFRCAQGGALDELRAAVFDDASYQWQQQSGKGAWVSLIDYRGDDLVFTLTHLARIEAWPEGEELAAMVRGFLSQVRLLQARAREAAA